MRAAPEFIVLMLVGLVLAIGPGMTADIPGRLSAALRNFEQHLRPDPWRPPWPEPEPVEMTRRERMGWRIAGVALAVLAFAGLVGSVR